MTTQIADLQTHWLPIAPLFALRNEADYDAAVARLNTLLDEIGTNQQHPLYSFLDTLGTLVHTYEVEHQSMPIAGGPGVLQYLMEEHGLSAAGLPEVGTPATVERFLAGKESLTIEQVRALAQRFHVSPAAFF